MSLESLLADLRQKKVTLWLEGDRIRYGGDPGVLTPDLLQEMRRYREDLVLFLRQAIASGGARLTPLARRSTPDSAPASPAQSRLWFLSRLEPDSAAYIIPQAFEIEGPLNRPALEESLGDLVSRHEALRTTLALEEGRLIQKIAVYNQFRLPFQEIPDGQAGAIQKLREWGKEPFDLENGPLFRARLLKMGEDRHLLFLAFHHAIADGWSLRIFYRELAVFYSARLGHAPASLPGLSIQYGDFCAAMADLDSGPEFEKQAEFWKRALAGAPAVLELPHDSPRPVTGKGIGGAVSMVISAPEWQAFCDLAREAGATSFMALLAVFQMWLGRLAGVEDVVVGTPIAGRERAEAQDIIGLFLNNLALRGDLAGNPTFRQLLARTRTVALDAFAHQGLPFDRLVAALNPERSLAYTPVFQVLINQLEQVESVLQLAGASIHPLAAFDTAAKYDLTLYSTPAPNGTTLELAFNSALFSPARAREMLRQIGGLVSQVIADPSRPLGEYTLLPRDGISVLPDPRLKLEQPRQQTVIGRFLEIARQSPNAIALSQSGQTWTYAELAAAVDRTAARLGLPANGAGATIAVSGRTSPGLVAAALAVWRSGAILTLVDPRLPAVRKELIISQGRVTHWVQVGPETADNSKTWIPGHVQRIEVGLRWDGLPDCEWGGRLENPDAYIFFTSGTTGIPKAVLGTHEGLAHFLEWQRTAFAVGPGDRTAQLTGLSFDVVLRDIFLPLTSGATLCLPDPDGDLAPDCVLPWLERERITLLHTVPSLASVWLDWRSVHPLPSLRWVFFAGEPLTESLVRRWRDAFGRNTQIANFYGPTETTLAKCAYVVPDPPHSGIQPVGFALPQTQALVLNSARQLCGIGEPGEIAIRTPFRSRGYLNAPSETAAKFLPNPFGNDSHDLIYLTGDRGRFEPSGALEILGRMDRQVKIRGVRVELDEVNAAIAAYTGVVSSAVIISDVEGERCLVGYFVASAADMGVFAKRLREHLIQTLPAALVPDELVGLDKLPLTANGKVNFAALPPVERSAVLATEEPVSEDRIEGIIARIWAELLPRAHIDLAASFFDLGGHSLMALKMIERVRQEFGRCISLRHLFLDPTIPGLARALREAPAVEVVLPAWCRSLASLQPGGKRPALYIFPGGRGGDYELYVHARIATHMGLDQPVFAFKARGCDGAIPPHDTMEDMVRDYLAELRACQPHGPYCFLGECLGGNIAFALACALQAQGEEVPFLALSDCIRPRWAEFQRYWLRSRGKKFRVSAAGRFLFNLPRMATLVTPGGRRWLREKISGRQAAGPSVLQDPSVPIEAIPTLEYWTPAGEAYRRVLSNYKPGMFRGRLDLILNVQDAEHPALMKWKENAAGGVRRHILPGNHLNYLWLGGAEAARICRGAIDEVLAAAD